MCNSARLALPLFGCLLSVARYNAVMPTKPKRTVIWHAKPDPRRGWIRDFGLSCGHVLVHRPLAKSAPGRPSIPERLPCTCCAQGAQMVAIRMPAHGDRTPIGWKRHLEAERKLAAERLAALPIVGQVASPPPRSEQITSSRPSRLRPSQVWSPRDLAARNYD